MKLILTVFVITVLLASVAVTASAADVLDLSTLGKKPSLRASISPPALANHADHRAHGSGRQLKN